MTQFFYIGTGALLARAQQAAQRAAMEAAEDLVGRSQALARVDTGAMRAGIHIAEASPAGFGFRVTVAAGAETSEYNAFQHDGTRYMTGTFYLSRPLAAMAPVYREYVRRAMAAAF